LAVFLACDIAVDFVNPAPKKPLQVFSVFQREVVVDKCVAFALLSCYTARGVIALAKTANLNIRLDPEVKSAVDALYSQFGITLADAVNIFLHKSIMAGGLPFDMTMTRHRIRTPCEHQVK
jgi:addiction module RelB/DinJ family antitoxin